MQKALDFIGRTTMVYWMFTLNITNKFVIYRQLLENKYTNLFISLCLHQWPWTMHCIHNGMQPIQDYYFVFDKNGYFAGHCEAEDVYIADTT